MIVPHRPLFLGAPSEVSYMRNQLAAIVFHTLAALAVTFFLDLKENKEKVGKNKEKVERTRRRWREQGEGGENKEKVGRKR